MSASRSVTNATIKNEGSGIYIQLQYPNGDWQSEGLPIGLYRSNYNAEKKTPSMQYVSSRCRLHKSICFLIDAHSVL